MHIQLLGPTQIALDGKVLQLSAKGRLLLTYLALEGPALHRTTVARLLWPQSDGLASLRVELSKLRALGVDLSPGRAPLLRLQHRTDLQALEEALTGTGPLPEDWLDGLRGEPLEGWDGLLLPALQPWLTGQRERLRGELGDLIRRAQAQAQGAGQTAVAEQIMRRAAALGQPLGHPENVPASRTILTGWLTDALRTDLFQAQQAAERAPHVLLYVGRAGSGRREALRTVLREQNWPALHLDLGAHPGLLLTSLMLRLLPLLPAERHAGVRALLDQPGEPHKVLQRLVPLLLDVGPLVLTLHVSESGPDGYSDLLDFALNWPLPLLLVSIVTPGQEEVARQQLGRHLGRFSVSRVPLVPAAALSADGPVGRELYQLVRHSEGWPAAAQALQPLTLAARPRLTEPVRALLLAEVRAALPGHSTVLASLAGLPGPFSEEVARGLLTDLGHPDAPGLLRQALRAGILERVPPVIEVALPDAQMRPPDGEHPLAFRSELQRAALATTLDPARRAALRAVAPALHVPALPPPIPLSTRVQPDQPQPMDGPGRSLLLPGGYHLHLRHSRRSVLRLGTPGHHAPAVHLRYRPAPDATSWRVVFRVDEFRAEAGGPPLSVLIGDGDSARHLTPCLSAQASGDWQELTGTLDPPGAPVRLVIRAANLILHLAEVSFDGACGRLPPQVSYSG